MPAFSLKPWMAAGLYPDWRQSVNVPGLSQCRNLRSSGLGLHTEWDAAGVEDSHLSGATPAITRSWPYPMYFANRYNHVVMTQTAIYYATIPDLALTQQTTYDFSTYNYATDAAMPKVITSGGQPWQFCDVGDGFILTNTQQVVFKTGYSDKIFVVDMTINSVCNLNKGRVFMAGFDPSDAIWGELETYLEEDETNIPDQLQGLYSAPDSDTVYWSSIGAPEIWGFFDFNIMKYAWFDDTQNTGYDDDTPFFDDLIDRNEFGFDRPQNSLGISRVIPFRNSVLLASTFGPVVAYYPKFGEYATFGEQNPNTGVMGIEGLEDVGSFGPFAFASGKEGCFFLDVSERLIWVKPDFSAEILDYRKHLAGLAGTHKFAHYDAFNKTFFYCTETKAFMLPLDGGMTEHHKTTPSMCNNVNALGAWTPTATPSSILVEFLPFTAALEQVGGMEGQAFALKSGRISTLDANQGYQMAWKYRVEKDKALQQTPWVTFNAAGVATFGRIPAISAAPMIQHLDRTQTHGIDDLYVDVDVGGPFGSRGLHDVGSFSTVSIETP